MQTSYANKPSNPAFAGSLADLGDNDVITRINNEGAAIPFGIAVALSGENTVDLPDNAADLIMGIAVHDHAHENRTLSGEGGIEDKDPVSILRKGRCWAICEDGCNDGGAVYVRHAANGGNTQLGRLLGADDGANASLLAGARWLTTATAGNLALLEVDMAAPGGVLS